MPDNRDTGRTDLEARWATERTLQRLLETSQDSNQILDRFLENAIGKEQIKLMREQARAMRDQNKNFAEDDTAERRLAEGMENLNKTERSAYYEMSEASDKLSSSFDRLDRILGGDHSSMIGSLSTTFRNIAREHHDKMSPALTKFVFSLGVASEAFSLMWNRVTALTTAYFDLYSSGIVFRGGLEQLNDAAAASGMNMEKFVSIMNKNSVVVANLGTVRTVALSKSFMTLTRRGVDLGMSVEEAQQSMFDYTDQLRTSGRLRRMTDGQIVNGSIEYGKALNEVTQLTGKRREQISAEIKDAAKKADFQVIMNSLNEQQKEALQAAVVQFQLAGESSGELQDMVVRYMSRGFAGLTQQQRLMLQQSGMTGKFNEYVRAVMNQDKETSTRLLREMGQGFRDASGRLRSFAAADGAIGDAARGLATFSMNVQNITDAELKQAEQAAQDAKDTQAAVNEMNAAMNSLSAAFTKIALPIVKLLVPAFEALASVVQKITKFFGVGDTGAGTDQEPSGFLSGGHLSSLVGSVVAIVGTMYIGKIVGFVLKGLMSAPGALLGKLTGPKIPGMPGGPSIPGLPDIGPGAERSAGAMGRIAKGFSGLGRGIGSTISSIMGGIAKGFASFGNPATLMGIAGIAGLAGSIWIAAKAFAEMGKVSWEDMGKAGAAILGLGLASAAAGVLGPTVAIGGAAIGAAIAAIGAGIAGAAWLLDKTLPDLVDGINKFNSIDGENLKSVGSGMISLGAGIAAMGGSGVLDALSGLASSILNFFSGQEDPIDRLKRFGELADPLNKATPALERFSTSFKSAVESLNSSTFGPNVRTTMDQLKELLSTDAGGWLGGAPPVIGQLNDLAKAIGNVADKALNLQEASSQQPIAPQTAAIDMQKKTIAFYEDQKQSNSSMISLLQAANSKLEIMNNSILTGSEDTVRAIKRNGSVF